MEINYNKLFTEIGHEAVRASGLFLVNVNENGFGLSFDTSSKPVFNFKLKGTVISIDQEDNFRRIPIEYENAYPINKYGQYTIGVIDLSDPNFDTNWKSCLSKIRDTIKKQLPIMINDLTNSQRETNKILEILKKLTKRLR